MAYLYFESLGPTRTIMEVASVGHYGSYGAIRNWSADFKWFEKAHKSDMARVNALVKKNQEANEHVIQTTINAIDFVLESIVDRDKDGNITGVNLKVESPDDVIKLVRLKSYLIGDDPEKTSGLSDSGNYHLAVVALIQEFRAKGYDPFTEQLEAFQTTGVSLLEKASKTPRRGKNTNGSGEHGEQAMATDEPLQD
jgi:hypothetical protein